MPTQREDASVPARAPDVSERFATLLADSVARARRLLEGGVGPLNEQQRLLVIDLFHGLTRMADAVGAPAVGGSIETFDLAAVANDVCQSFRFIAHGKQVVLTIASAERHVLCVADQAVVRNVLRDIVGAAIDSTPRNDGHVAMEVTGSADRCAVDVCTSRWKPRLPPCPPPASNVVVSVLHMASGTRLVLSVPAAR